MSKLEGVLVLAGVLLLAVALVLLLVHNHVGECVDLVEGGCVESGFVYEGGGKLALLAGFGLFLTAALHRLFSGPDKPNR